MKIHEDNEDNEENSYLVDTSGNLVVSNNQGSFILNVRDDNKITIARVGKLLAMSQAELALILVGENAQERLIAEKILAREYNAKK